MNGISLPEEFLSRIREYFSDEKEYTAFLDSYSQERTYGLRFNPLKCDAGAHEKILEAMDMHYAYSDPVTWCDGGYYYNSDSCPGRSPYHEAGAFYIQEPSAMSVVGLCPPKPGERVCDLCAAPGGKTTHIAGFMKNKGLIVSNEIVPDRARILSQNVERMGIRNCIVTSETPDALALRFPGYFTRVFVDAPCSGEGMFRKDSEAIAQWSVPNVEKCVERQKDILKATAEMVAPGGYLIYSTCTFEYSEDEQMIEEFLTDHPEFYKNGDSVIRIWPHKERGEGHFAAVLKKEGEYTIPDSASVSRAIADSRDKKTSKKRTRSDDLRNKNVPDKESLLRFLHTETSVKEDSELYERILHGELMEHKDRIWLLPSGISKNMLSGIRVIRPGLCLAEYDRGRFKPDHALAMSLGKEEIKNICNLNYKKACAFLRGETFESEAEDIPSGSWTVCSIDDVSMGWGKLTGGIVKNHYPKGLRKNVET